MIDRRCFSGALAGLLLAAPRARAQEPVRVRRLGLLSPAHDASAYVDALRSGLRDLGFIEGRNLVIDIRTGDRDQLPALAAELLTSGAEVIVADTTTAARAARAASTTAPIVALVGDPVGSGLAQSLARPGWNVTGIASLAQELAAKRLKLRRAALPAARSIAVLYRNPDNYPDHEVSEAGRTLGLVIEALQVGGSEALRAALQSAVLQRVDAVSIWPDPLFTRHSTAIISRVAELRRPAIFGEREYVAAGGLMSYGPDMGGAFHRLASFVDRVLKGAEPRDLPFERVDKVELVLNLATAKALRLELPATLLLRADEVIE